MASILNASGLTKQFGAAPLFANISFNISDGDRLGLVGPNGSGKSTLLEILAGRQQPDTGNVAMRKGARIAFVRQVSDFDANVTVQQVVEEAFARAGHAEDHHSARVAETLGKAGFVEFDVKARTLSGGWRKRLAIAKALVGTPDLLLLDEPTNHLDLAGIEWLEKLLQSSNFACVVVSHDRYFLENAVTDMAELNRTYPDGIFRVRSTYSGFLEKKSEFMAAQVKRQEALENRVKTEIDWLRRGPKARATKAKARIDKAHEMIGQLNDLQGRMQTSRANIDFSATERKTKRLIDVRNVDYQIAQRELFSSLNLVLAAGTRVGLVGANGSGKTTLLRLLRGEMAPGSGAIERAEALRIVYFDQNRPLDPELTLRRALAPHSDSVVYQDQTIHVASWAARFLFGNEQLNQPVSRLSGGERARVLIAKLMLESADVLLLDEPTNDLDIPTLEVLEESLLEFRGALVLVTHDRYMLDRVSTVVWGLDGSGSAELFADYSQWESAMTAKSQTRAKPAQMSGLPTATATTASNKKKLSYLDNRDFQTIENRITDAETTLVSRQQQLEDLAIMSDPQRLQVLLAEIETAKEEVDGLYARWAELEAKIG